MASAGTGPVTGAAREFVVEADGGSRGNPGPAGYGAVVLDAATGEPLVETAEYLGVVTNNVAEYRGLLAGLRAAYALDPSATVHVRMDSKLVVEQMSGRWKIKHPDMKPLAAQAAGVFPPGRVTYEWIPRASNKHADRLANEAMDAGARGEQWSPPAPPARETGAAGAAEADVRAARSAASSGAGAAEAVVPAGERAAGPVAPTRERAAPEAAAAHGGPASGSAPAVPASAAASSGAGTAEAAKSPRPRSAEPAQAPGERVSEVTQGSAGQAGKAAQAPGERVAEADQASGERVAEADQASGERVAEAARAPRAGGVTAAPGSGARAAGKTAAPGWGPPDMGAPATFVLLRHGETPLTPQKRFSGSGGSDPSLSAVGREQAEKVAEGLARRGTIQAVVASPLARTRETAAVVAARLGLEVEIEDGLRETDFGAWEGLTFAEVRERYPDDLNAWLASPDARPTGGGESFAATGARVAAARDKLVAAYAGRTVLLVSHVTPIKTFIRLALGAPPESLFRMELSAASLSAVAYYADGGASLRLFNETSHLR
ncbi:bifunctional RNase H/acid phosphatase [Streptomyces sp. NPDC047725]|uniref:bifunctional RNase H/acid phosphatase n=1 Tax=Streptomyces sp. NPDC047725 TaxID=3365487 RepID=UPI003722F3A7